MDKNSSGARATKVRKRGGSNSHAVGSGPPLTFRRGWENELLAGYLLSRISYISNPVTVSDDKGTDYFCTLFTRERKEGKEYGCPRTSFAIQIKSSDENIKVSDKIEYLDNLDLPLFIGVVTQCSEGKASKLEVYSAELIPFLFAHKWFPNTTPQRHLELVLKKDQKLSRESYTGEGKGHGMQYVCSKNENSHELVCPFIAELTPDDDENTRNDIAKKLIETCYRARAIISTYRMKEHIYKLPGVDESDPIVLAGSGSHECYRRNVEYRLAEVFCNHIWIVRNLESLKKDDPGYIFPREEYEAFRDLYIALDKSSQKPSDLVRRVFDELQVELQKKPGLVGAGSGSSGSDSWSDEDMRDVTAASIRLSDQSHLDDE